MDQPLDLYGIEAFKVLAETFGTAPMPLFLKTADGIHILCNQAYYDILDVVEEQVIGHRIDDFAPEGIVFSAKEKDEDLKTSNYKNQFSYRITFVDFQNSKRYFDVYKNSPPFTYRGQKLILGCVIDVSEQVRYRDELTAQHKFLRTVIDNLPQLIYTKDLESRFTLANKAVALLMTGKPDPALLIGKTDANFFRPGLWVKYYNDEQEVIQKGKAILNLLEPCEDESGNTRWNITSKLPLFDDAGNVTGIIGIGSDFTQFKHNEEQLRLQATALETAADSVLITDRQGTIIWANTATCRTTGFGMSEMIGATPRIFRSGCQSMEFYRHMWRTIISGHVWKGEMINRRKDGDLRTIETTIAPVNDNNNRITHFVSISRDITERQLLRQEMSQIYAAVSGAKDGILLLSKDNKPFFVNKSFTTLLGYTMIDLPAEIIATITRAHNEDLNAEPDNTNTRIRQEELVANNGDSIPVEIRDWPVEGDDGETIGRVYFVRDMRDERRRADAEKMMEVRLRQAQKMEAIGQLAAGIAHEINNPIQFIGNNTNFLKSTFDGLSRLVEAQRKALEDAGVDTKEAEEIAAEIDLDYLREEVPLAIDQTLDGIHRVSDIVKAMKDFSHPGTKSRMNTDLNKAVKDAILVARNEWKYHSEIETDLAPDLPLTLCLAGEINQVILNILVNSSQAITEAVEKGLRKKGLIKIHTEYDKKEIRIIFTDNGMGIPKSIQNRIFEPFFTTKEVGKGTGQGLAIAYDVVVRKHDGKISLKSVEGEGTTFTVALPRRNKTDDLL